jgi:hypothetical protein
MAIAAMDAEEQAKNRMATKDAQDRQERHEWVESLRSRIAELKGEKRRLAVNVTKEMKKPKKDNDIIDFLKEQQMAELEADTVANENELKTLTTTRSN